MILPRLITCVRLQLGPAWLFLIAAEAIAATQGWATASSWCSLAMDVILPYVAWITLLAFVTDLLLPGCRGGPSPGPRPREPGAGPALMEELGDRSILERINLDVASGSFVTLVGASGCGKSTFLRILLGQERASRGTILVDGAALPDEPGP